MLGTYVSVDGSRMRLEVTSQNSVLFMPDGSRYLFGQNAYIATTHIDPHGNQMSYDIANRRWTDTLGRIINDPLPLNWNDFEQTQTVGDQAASFPGIGTGTVNVTLSWRYLKDPSNGESGLENPSSQTLHSLSNTGCNGNGNSPVTGPYLYTSPEINLARVCQPGTVSGLDWTQGPPFNPVVLTKITLANGQFYEFKYNVYGEITKIIYPTGGYERFVYGYITPLDGGEPTYAQSNRGVTARYVSVKGDGTDEIPWSYQVSAPTDPAYIVTITNPDNSRTEQYLHREPITPPVAYGFIREQTGRSYEDRVYSTANQLMKRNLTKYVSTGAQSGGYAGATRDLRVEKQVSITFEPGETNALAQLTETVYETPGQSGAPLDPAYFAAQNAKQTKVYHYVSVNAATAAGSATDIDAALLWFSGASPATVSEMDYLYNANYLARNISGLMTETRVKDSSGSVKAKSQIIYDETSYLEAATVTNAPGWTNPNSSVRGLPTTTKSWHDIANNQFIETHASYDQFGNPRKNWDGKGNFTEIQYTDNYTDNVNRYSYALPTKTISYSGNNGTGVMFETSIKYDFNTGLVRYTTDANNQTSEIQYNDALLRPTKTIAPNGHQTITEYGAGTGASTRFVKVKTQIDAERWKEGYTFFDGLGKTVKTQSVDSNGDVFSLTCYDQYGRMEKASNPFRNVSNPTCSSALEWTTTTYDAAGRVWKVKTPDNAEVVTAYSLATSGNNIGTVVMVTDQAGKQRRSITNALGHLARVDEPDNSGDLGTVSSPKQPTNYTYDVLNNLLTVSQIGTTNEQCGSSTTNCSQTRTFEYDSLSRLKSATNPESGLIQYIYDNNGNLTQKTDARGVVTAYFYDALNRVTNRNYSTPGGTPPNYQASPNVTYTYDDPAVANSKGKLTRVAATLNSTVTAETKYQAFDILGRVTQSQQWVDGVSYGVPMTYTYNLSGAMIEQKYPSGRVVRNVLDNDGDLAIVQSKKTANSGYWDYAKNFTYTAAGAVSSMQLGNGKWESTSFNSRLQPTQISLGTVQNGTDKLKLNFDYGNVNNNGNVLSQTITVPTETINGTTYNAFTAIQTYSYDSLNRIKDAKEMIGTNQQWKQTFTYDRYGNRRFDEANTTTLTANCPTAVCNPTIDPATNKLIGYQFDASGNTKVDAENRTFIYDGENKQVEVLTASNASIGKYFYDGDGKRVKKISATETTIFVYNAGGQLVAEYSPQIAQGTDAKVSYLTADHLGSPRITTDQNGQVVSRRDFQPFGEEIQRAGYGTDSVRQKFTAYERDTETELDYAQARYFNSGFGRFSSPDDFSNDTFSSNPQSWNLYTYVRNNPLRFIDPTGERIWIYYQESMTRTLADGSEITETVTQRVEYTFGKLLNEDGSEYIGNNEYVANAANSLSFLLQDEVLGSAIRDMVISKEDFNIMKDPNDPNNNSAPDNLQKKGKGATIYWSGKEGKYWNNMTEAERSETSPAYAILAHELIGHAWMRYKGIERQGQVRVSDSSVLGFTPIGEWEIDAVNIENRALMLENPCMHPKCSIIRIKYGGRDISPYLDLEGFLEGKSRNPKPPTLKRR